MFQASDKSAARVALKNTTPLWKWVLILVLIIFAWIYALPNIYGESPALQISSKEGSPVTLTLVQTIKNTLLDNAVAYSSMNVDQNNISLKFSSMDQQLAAEETLAPLLQDNYVMALNLIPNTPSWLQHLNANPMKLGLDLRGGMYFLLNIDMQVVLQNHLQNTVQSMMEDLQSHNIHYAGINIAKDQHILLNFRNASELEAAKILLNRQYSEWNVRSSGLTINANLTPEAEKALSNNAVAQTVDVMRNRVNELGVAEATVAKEGDDRLVIELPGVQDATRAKAIIGGTATLKAMLVNDKVDPLMVARTHIVPPGSSLYYDGDHRPWLLYDNVIITGNAISDASVGYDPQTNLPLVQVSLSGPQVAYFSEVTGKNVGHPMAIVLVENTFSQERVNGQAKTVSHTLQTVVNVATIQSQLGNRFQITGLGSVRMAQNLALMIRAGALPAPVQIIEEKQVGPSLGSQNIKMGAWSVIVALSLVMIFIALYYRKLGLIADLCLLLNLIFIVAVMSLLPGATLTLPGIAGIVLNVGIAIDANVLIFERIREELRKGGSNALAIHTGYERAFSTILDANVTTFMVALILFSIGTGAVKGFAVTLMIGIVTSMFCAVVISRAFVNLIYGKHPQRKLSIGI